MAVVNGRECYLSKYVIFQKIKNDGYVLIHTYFNNIDIVEEDIAAQLLKIKNDQNIEHMDEKIFDELLQKCYLVEDKTIDKERFFAVVNKLIEKKNKHSSYFLIPSYACNFSCPYCFEGKLTYCKDNLVMSTHMVDTIFDMIEQEKNNQNGVSLSLFGGEPLRAETLKINEYIFQKAKKQNLKISAITNGYDLDRYMKYISDDVFSGFQITFDGSKEYHNKNKFTKDNGDTFSKLLDNIELILKTKAKVFINARINTNKENVKSLKTLQQIFQSRGFTKDERFSFYTKSIDECLGRKTKELSDIGIVENVDFFTDKAQNMRTNSQYNYIFQELEAIFDPNRKFGNFRTQFCGANGSNKLIDPYGDVYSCLEEVGKKERRVGFIDIENKKIVCTPLFDEWAKRTVQNIPECSECSYALICGGGCGIAALKKKGTLKAPWCGENKEIAQKVVCEIVQRLNV